MIITYICPAVNYPAGGVKVAYRHSEILSNSGIESFVLHPQDTNFSCTWFEHKTKIRDGSPFDPQRDFLVVPEIWAAAFGRVCSEKNLKYAIFVQNGYLINAELKEYSAADLKKSYENAALIMSISEDTAEMVALAYPKIPREKIVRILPNIGNRYSVGEKSNIITFMPRKLPEHSGKVCFFLQELLPGNWEIVPIHNLDEAATANLLSQSRVFMSFCDQEGFGLPPIEAGLSGAIVVGYTGQGASEYFEKPIFRKIENGDYRSFIKEILAAIEDAEAGFCESSVFQEGIASLRMKYSVERERECLLSFAQKVATFY